MGVCGSPRRWDHGDWCEIDLLQASTEHSLPGATAVGPSCTGWCYSKCSGAGVAGLMVNMETKFSGSSKTSCRPPCSKRKGLSSSVGSENPVKYS